MNNRPWLLPVAIACITVVLLACLCLALAGFFGWMFYTAGEPAEQSGLPRQGEPTQTPRVIRPTPITPLTPSASGGEGLNLIVPHETLRTLEETIVPINDLPDLARRLEGKEGVPRTVSPPAGELPAGTQEEFWVTNVDTNENFRIPATLQYVTEHVYFWVQDEVSFDAEDLRNLAETFENEIYPTNREFFGSEWTPGVDGDPHLYILYAEGLGWDLAGYFSSADEYHPLAHEFSNAHEMFLLNADNLELDEPFTYGVLAHEFQHMIHWYRDRNESSWLNEGFSELAAFLNGYDVGGTDESYVRNPDHQLNDWPNDSSQTGPHYGASFLFLTYFLDRFGEEATRSLVAHDENSLESVDEVLDGLETTDPLTGEEIHADDLFMDWILATFLNDQTVADGRYAYHNYPDAPRALETEIIRRCPRDPFTRDVHQYGVDFVRFTCPGDFTLHFEGSLQVGLLPVDPLSGNYAFWSNKGDESDMTLTREFDFSGHSGPLTLSYWTWYDLEEDYDYVYVEASTDGEQWEILSTPSGTPEDPSGNSYGWGYNGASGWWIQEQVDLSGFAGEEVQLRFEYVTDAAVNGEGFLLDDVAVPEIGYSSDFEADTGGWQAEGWVRIQNSLPQMYRLALITRGDTTTVTEISLSEDNTAEIPLSIGGEVDDAVLVIAGTTRYTRQKTGYQLEITP